MRIMERAEAESRRWAWWKPALAFALAAALLVVFFWPKPTPRPVIARRTPAPATGPAATPAHKLSDSPRVAVRTRLGHRHAPAPVRAAAETPALAPAGEPIVVKLLTNDPNVVIYWITDTKGDY
jgi:hypothetical protein